MKIPTEVQEFSADKNTKAYEPTADEQLLITNVWGTGAEFKVIHQKLGEIFTDAIRKQVHTLKTDVFQIYKGSAGRKVSIAQVVGSRGHAKKLFWDEFCHWCWGVTARRINQLLDTDDAKSLRGQILKERVQHRGNGDFERMKRDALEMVKEGHKVLLAKDDGATAHPLQNAKAWTMARLKATDLNLPEPSTVGPCRSTEEAVALVKAAWEGVKDVGDFDINEVKAIDAAFGLIETEKNFNALAVKAASADPVERIEVIGDNPHYERKDPYAYFEQFKSEPQMLGDELAAMLIEFGLDLYQIKDVLRYAEKDAKLTLGKTKAVAA